MDRVDPRDERAGDRDLQRFFNWYADIDDDFVSPMRKLHRPDCRS